jgi:hypothetical protein
MSGQADISAPQAARGSDPVEDQRRDEVLCRLLNTPYRPIDRLRAKAPGTEARPIEIPVKA